MLTRAERYEVTQRIIFILEIPLIIYYLNVRRSRREGYTQRLRMKFIK